MIITLPPAPNKYSQKDQDNVRRIITAALRELQNRIAALENA